MVENDSTGEATPTQGAAAPGQTSTTSQTLASTQADKPGDTAANASSSQSDNAQRRASRDQTSSAPPWRVEGAPKDDKDQDGGGRRAWTRFCLTMLVLLLLNWLLASSLITPSRTTVSYTFFWTQLNARNVQSITATGNTIEGTFKHEVAYPPKSAQAQPVTQFTSERPTFATDPLYKTLVADGVTISANPPNQGAPLWEDLLLWFGPALLLGLFLSWIWRSGRMGGLTGMGGMGQSHAKRYDPTTEKRTTFADVAGIDDVKNEVMEIVDFLKEPRRYQQMGARVPHGVLLCGEPGTGKTLLARAVAGEAAVPFFSISASEFIEMIVGVGASRVRDLFDQAKQVAPSIIFIDEIDAIGRSRSASGSTGSYDEREQTLNQILTEMDGFTGTEGVVVLAATNRPEILDSALLRPGRFDRRVTVSAPDQRGRRQILEVHSRTVPLAADVNLDVLASSTPGMVGADLANLVNEAALLAVHRHHDQVTMADFTDSLEKIYLGTARGIVLPKEEQECTAYHESGHALLGMLTPGADPVRKITIIPRGQALGVTFQSPQADRYSYSAEYLRGRITGALGGRAAEEVVYGVVTTGAESDLDHATGLARQMVGRWGMSSAIGPVTVLPPPNQESPFGLDNVAPATKELVDTEVRRIIEECYKQALSTLGANRDRLNSLAHALLARETLDEDEAYAAAGLSPGAVPPARTPSSTVPTGISAS